MFSMSSFAFATDEDVMATSLSQITVEETNSIDCDFDTIQDGSVATFSDDEVSNNLKTGDFESLDAVFSDSLKPMTASDQPSFYANAQLDLGVEPVGNLTATLSQDQIHILTFQLKENKTLFSKMESSNGKYAFQIYRFVDDTTLEPYSNAVMANNVLNGTIPSGRYAFVIANLGTSYGAQYTMYMNTSTPSPANAVSIKIIKLSDSYKHVTVQMIDSKGKIIVYCDGVEVYNENNPTKLDWERVLDLSWSGGYNYNKHEIYSAQIQGISGVGTYTSDYVKSNNAVILFLDVGTGYMYNESKRNSTTGERVFHFYDPFGNKTPRKLTADDIDKYHCWLVFDLSLGRPIDFWSSLNWYYATGSETARFNSNGA